MIRRMCCCSSGESARTHSPWCDQRPARLQLHSYYLFLRIPCAHPHSHLAPVACPFSLLFRTCNGRCRRCRHSPSASPASIINSPASETPSSSQPLLTALCDTRTRVSSPHHFTPTLSTPNPPPPLAPFSSPARSREPPSVAPPAHRLVCLLDALCSSHRAPPPFLTTLRSLAPPRGHDCVPLTDALGLNSTGGSRPAVSCPLLASARLDLLLL